MKLPTKHLLVLFAAIALSASAETGPVPPTPFWNAHVGYNMASSPAVGTNGVIYATTFELGLLAFNPDGSKRWRFPVLMQIKSSPAIAGDGTVYFGCRDRKFYAVDAEGKLKWTFTTGAWVDSSPAIAADGTVFFGSWDGKFYALNPDGSKQWEFATAAPVMSSPAIGADGTVYFGSHDGNFYALNPGGSKKWSFATGGAVISSPAITAEGAILFTSLDGKFYSLNPDGTKRWETRTGGITEASPALGADGSIFLGINTNYFKFTPDAKPVWQRGLDPRGHAVGEWTESAPAILEDGACLTVGGDHACVLRSADGTMRWQFFVEGPSQCSPAVGADGTFFATGTGRKLFALPNNIPLANSSWPMFRGNAQHTGRVNAGKN